MPALITAYENRPNGIQTQVVNLREVAGILRTDPLYILKHWEYAFGVPAELHERAGSGKLIGKLTTAILQESLDRFIDMFLLCGNCKYPESVLIAKRGQLWSICNACGAKLPLDSSHHLAAFILNSVSASKAQNKTRIAKSSQESRKPVITTASQKMQGAITGLRPANEASEDRQLIRKDYSMQSAESPEAHIDLIAIASQQDEALDIENI